MKSSEPHLQLNWKLALSLHLPLRQGKFVSAATRLLLAAGVMIGVAILVPLAACLLL